MLYSCLFIEKVGVLQMYVYPLKSKPVQRKPRKNLEMAFFFTSFGQQFKGVKNNTIFNQHTPSYV